MIGKLGWKKIICAFFIFAWSIFVIGGYFTEVHLNIGHHKTEHTQNKIISAKIRPSHEYYFDAINRNIIVETLKDKQKTLSPILNVLLVLSGIYIIYAIKKNHDGFEKLQINTSPLVFYGLFTLIFIMCSYSLVSLFELGNSFSFTHYFLNYLSISWKVLLVVLIALSCGKKIFQLIEKETEKDPLSEAIFSFGLGAVFVSLLTFIIGSLGQINQKSIIYLFVAIFVLCFSEAIYWLEKFFFGKVKCSFDYASPQVFLGALIAIFASFNLVALLKPIPIGHDELEQYMNVTNLLATNGKLLGGYMAYPWQLFLSSVLALYKSEEIASIFSSISGFLVVIGIYQVAKIYCLKRKIKPGFYPLLAAALFFTMPATVFQLTLDIKVDLPALFFACLGLISYWKWQENIKNYKWLFLATFLVGFAFLIKATLLFFALSLIVCLIIFLIRVGVTVKKILTLAVLCFVFFCLPFLPFGIKNAVELSHAPKENVTYTSILYGYTGTPIIKFSKAENEEFEKNKEIFKSNDNSEISRYGGFKTGISKYFLYPFITTFNTSVSGKYIDTGFLFLLFVPFGILLYRFVTKKQPENRLLYAEVAIAAIVYWLLWASFSKGIIWYGFPGFIFMLLLIVEVLNYIKKSNFKILVFISGVMLTLWLTLTLLMCTNQMSKDVTGLIDDVNLVYSSNKVSDLEYFEVIIPKFVQIIKVTNEDIDKNSDNPPKVYIVGKYLKYFIHRNNETVYEDSNISGYYALSANRSGAETLDRFKDVGIKYLVLDPNGITFFGDNADKMKDKTMELIKIVRENPSKVEILSDDQEYGTLFVKLR